MMVGKKVSLNIERTAPVNPQDRIELKNVTTLNAEGVKAIDNLSFTIRSGEILGIAGIAGSGQRNFLKLLRGFKGLKTVKLFIIHLKGKQLTLKLKPQLKLKNSA